MVKRFTKPYPIYLLAVLLALFCGCGPVLIPFDKNVPAQVLSYIGAPPVHDARTRFRGIFCDLLDRNRQQPCTMDGCDDCLWRLSDEPQTSAGIHRLPDHDPGLTILIVPGAFSGCIEKIGAPFHDGSERLRQMGYRIESIDISGLSSSRRNAEIIAEAVTKYISGPSHRLILLGYSKGTTDILHFLVAYPDLALRIEAVLSVAGAVNGSPLADRYTEVEYDNWLARLFPERCQPGDRGVFDSLSRTQQFQWLATHPLPDHVRYYSLASFARYADVQMHLQPTYKLLEQIHPLNDGQLLFIDQLIPGSTLLGYVNADHWTIAIPVEEKFSRRDPALKDRHRQLRDALFEAMVLFLAEDLKFRQ
jgi:hypothetical protein